MSPSLNLGAMASQLGALCACSQSKKQKKETKESDARNANADTRRSPDGRAGEVRVHDCGPSRHDDWLVGLQRLWISLKLRLTFLRSSLQQIDNTTDMAGPSDKARFYLEQSATELNELERKKIFTRVSFLLLFCRPRTANVQ